jgi:DNA-binding winged helix-turn-helix (wHTH) protein
MRFADVKMRRREQAEKSLKKRRNLVVCIMTTGKRTIFPAEIHFHEFKLDLNLRRLYKRSVPIRLTPKPFSTLEFLIHNRHRVVSKAELLENVWGELRGESTVEQAVRQLRKALQDDPAIPQYIETIPGQGYRFIAPVVDHQAILQAEDSADALNVSAANSSGGVCASGSEIHATEEPPIAPVVTNWRSQPRAAAIGIAGLGIIILSVLLTLRLVREPNPQQATVVGTELTALDGAGHAIWRYQFPRALLAIAPELDSNLTQNSEVHVEDLNGDGKNEVLVAASYGLKSDASDELYCFARAVAHCGAISRMLILVLLDGRRAARGSCEPWRSFPSPETQERSGRRSRTPSSRRLSSSAWMRQAMLRFATSVQAKCTR